MNLFQVTKKQEIEGYELRTMTGDIVSFTPSYSEPLPEPFSNLHVKCEINATGGNGTPDNPNPINGYTALNLTACGVNLWDEEWEIGGIDDLTGNNYVKADRIRSKNFIPVKSSETYYLSMSSNGAWIYCYDINKTYISYRFIRYGNNTFNFTRFPNAAYIRFEVFAEYGTTYHNDISINYPSTDTDYHPYAGNTYTIAFGQMVYGCVLDVTRGKLHVTHKIVDLGDFGWINENNEQTGLCRANTQFTDCVWQSVMVCSAYNYNPTTSYNGLSDGDIALTNSESISLLRIRNTDYSTYTSTQIKEAVTGMKLVYQTKTPFDIDLTPQQIEALLGVNNVWHDGNGDIEVTCLI